MRPRFRDSRPCVPGLSLREHWRVFPGLPKGEGAPTRHPALWRLPRTIWDRPPWREASPGRQLEPQQEDEVSGDQSDRARVPNPRPSAPPTASPPSRSRRSSFSRREACAVRGGVSSLCRGGLPPPPPQSRGRTPRAFSFGEQWAQGCALVRPQFAEVETRIGAGRLSSRPFFSSFPSPHH